MAFTVPEFPGINFETIEEYRAALFRKQQGGLNTSEEVTQVTAVIMPASRELLERKVYRLEKKLARVDLALQKVLADPEPKKRTLEIGTVLKGESKGKDYTLEVIVEGFLCSNGEIYQSLSGAALGVSGNRRSGWKFWKETSGKPIGEIVGRFKESAENN